MTRRPHGRRPSTLIPLVGVVGLLAACSGPTATVVSEPPGERTSAIDPASSSGTTTAAPSGRYVARCATEGDPGATPGDTVYTDGSHGTTDFCLRRFYMGIQPAPGSVYVPDDQAGNHTPTTPVVTTPGGTTWTPQQPRTDSQAVVPTREGTTTASPEPSAPAEGGPGAEPTTPEGGTAPSSTPSPTAVPIVPLPPVLDPARPTQTAEATPTPGGTAPGAQGTTPGGGATDGKGSSNPSPTSVPVSPQPAGPPFGGSAGSAGSGASSLPWLTSRP